MAKYETSGVDRGRDMFGDRHRKDEPKLSTTSGVDRGRLAYVAQQTTPEGLAAKKRLQGHFAKPKNDTGTEFAANFQEDTE